MSIHGQFSSQERIAIQDAMSALNVLKRERAQGIVRTDNDCLPTLFYSESGMFTRDSVWYVSARNWVPYGELAVTPGKARHAKLRARCR